MQLLGGKNVIILAESDDEEETKEGDAEMADEEQMNEETTTPTESEEKKTKRMRTGIFKRSRNAYVDGSHEFQHSRDDDYSDLDDFIVCRPGVSYYH